MLRIEAFTPFIRMVGFIKNDDISIFCGPTESVKKFRPIRRGVFVWLYPRITIYVRGDSNERNKVKRTHLIKYPLPLAYIPVIVLNNECHITPITIRTVYELCGIPHVIHIDDMDAITVVGNAERVILRRHM